MSEAKSIKKSLNKRRRILDIEGNTGVRVCPEVEKEFSHVSHYLDYSHPGFGLFFFLPFRVALSIYLTVAAASGFVYFKILKAMSSKAQTGFEQMVGEEAVVIEDLDPEGKVEIMDEIWKARSNGKKFPKGRKVKVSGVQGLVLIVEDPEEKRNSAKG